jgi:flagellar hook-length control protein FliK
MQFAKPVSTALSLPAIVLPSAAGGPLNPSASDSSFAAVLGSQGNNSKSTTPNATRVSAPKVAASEQHSTGPSQKTEPSRSRPLEGQPERNRLKLSHESRQLSNKPLPATNKLPGRDQTQVSAAKTQTNTPAQETAVRDNEEEVKPVSESVFNPLALLQWLGNQAAQTLIQPERIAIAAEAQATLGETATNEATTQLPAKNGDLSVFSTIKTAADGTAPAALSKVTSTPDLPQGSLDAPAAVSNSFAQLLQVPQVPQDQQVLKMPPEPQQPTPEERTEENHKDAAPQDLSAAPLGGGLGLEGWWTKAVGSVATEIAQNSLSAVKKTGAIAPVETNTAPQPSTLNAGTAGMADTPTVSFNLPATVQSPEFRELLGSQISLLAKEGVQAAELHLNPSEMGPVSVQITLDGTQARVDFGADSALTREVIESSLPELASALRDAGLTLSGGGVSQHTKGRGDQSENKDSSGKSKTTGGDGAPDALQRPSASNRRVALGGVDLYA